MTEDFLEMAKRLGCHKCHAEAFALDQSAKPCSLCEARAEYLRAHFIPIGRVLSALDLITKEDEDNLGAGYFAFQALMGVLNDD
jgi:hypothetical protein